MVPFTPPPSMIVASTSVLFGSMSVVLLVVYIGSYSSSSLIGIKVSLKGDQPRVLLLIDI